MWRKHPQVLFGDNKRFRPEGDGSLMGHIRG